MEKWLAPRTCRAFQIRSFATFLQHEARQRSHHQAAAFGDGSTLALAARCKACLVWSLSISPLVQWCVCRRCIQGCGAFIMLKMTQVLETSTDERSKIWKPLCTMPDQAHLIGKKHIMADERGLLMMFLQHMDALWHLHARTFRIKCREADALPKLWQHKAPKWDQLTPLQDRLSVILAMNR